MAKEKKPVACKNCGAEMAANAKACPQCGAPNKKPFYKRGWFIALVVLVVIAAMAGTGGNGSSDTPSANRANVGQSEAPSAAGQESEKPEITYTAYTVSQLIDDLDSNALKASEKYKDQYVELTGRMDVIDSSGDYISLSPADKEFTLTGVRCYIKNDEQKEVIMNASTGDTLVVKGKIKSVGEVLGYSLDMDEVSKAD